MVRPTQWSMPSRHFLGLCRNCINRAAVTPVVYTSTTFEASSMQAFWADTGAKRTGDPINAFDEQPVSHVMFHFADLTELINKTIHRVNLVFAIDSGSSNEDLLEFRLRIQRHMDAEDPAGIEDYLALSFEAYPREFTLDVTEGVPDDFRINAKAQFLRRVQSGYDAEGNWGTNIAVESHLGTPTLDYGIQWEGATLEVDYYE